MTTNTWLSTMVLCLFSFFNYSPRFQPWETYCWNFISIASNGWNRWLWFCVYVCISDLACCFNCGKRIVVFFICIASNGWNRWLWFCVYVCISDLARGFNPGKRFVVFFISIDSNSWNCWLWFFVCILDIAHGFNRGKRFV